MTLRRALIVTACLAATCCAPAPHSAPVSTPAPPPPPAAPSPPPPVVSQPVYEDWMDAPATAGDWTIIRDSTGTMARFGPTGQEPVFALRCNPANRIVSLLRAGTANGTVAMRIRTETADRMLTASQLGDQLQALRVDLPARDPSLAAIAFSKGRFAVATQGQRTLYIPAWPEITRVVEDCL